MNQLPRGRAARLAIAAGLMLLLTEVSSGYSVLTHEAIVDSMWDSGIKPLLVKRFGAATPEELRKAHAYAYGGAIIQDMGYYPFGSKVFSDLAHYVRSGRFVEVLVADSQDIYEYSFALGALCHYASDNSGHAIAVNPAVPILYPKLRRQYGPIVTYAEDPTAHIRTEFGFDVVQVSLGKFAAEDYHDFIGFEVSKPLLERAFKETYGIEIKSVFTSLDLALGTYRRSVSTIIPEMTKVAWISKKDEIEKDKPGITAERFRFKLSRSVYEKEWGKQYERPGVGSRILAAVFTVLPKVGPFKALSFKAPTREAERLFIESVEATTNRYKQLLAEVGAGRLQLQDTNLDTGKSTRLGEYNLADRAYTTLLDRIAGNHFQNVTPDLRDNILAFFGNGDAGARAVRDRAQWEKTLNELNQLKAIPTQPVQTGRK